MMIASTSSDMPAPYYGLDDAWRAAARGVDYVVYDSYIRRVGTPIGSYREGGNLTTQPSSSAQPKRRERVAPRRTTASRSRPGRELLADRAYVQLRDLII